MPGIVIQNITKKRKYNELIDMENEKRVRCFFIGSGRNHHFLHFRMDKQ